jgi:hypothetical protein
MRNGAERYETELRETVIPYLRGTFYSSIMSFAVEGFVERAMLLFDETLWLEQLIVARILPL